MFCLCKIIKVNYFPINSHYILNKFFFSRTKFAKFFFFHKIKLYFIFTYKINMQKTLCQIISFGLILCSISLLTYSYWQQFQLWNTSTILNTDINQAVNTDLWSTTIWDPLRQWAYQVVHSDDWLHELWWIIDSDTQITDHNTALNRTLNIIKSIINYALSLLSLVALIYMIYHGFLMLSAAWDDSRYKNWFKWIKNSIIAIAGIWLSRFVISLIFRIIENASKI